MANKLFWPFAYPYQYVPKLSDSLSENELISLILRITQNLALKSILRTDKKLKELGIKREEYPTYKNFGPLMDSRTLEGKTNREPKPYSMEYFFSGMEGECWLDSKEVLLIRDELGKRKKIIGKRANLSLVYKALEELILSSLACLPWDSREKNLIVSLVYFEDFFCGFEVKYLRSSFLMLAITEVLRLLADKFPSSNNNPLAFQEMADTVRQVLENKSVED